MASIGIASAAGGRRELNHELALVPFIDFLLCLVAFLLVTAVWSQHARLNADARVPGAPNSLPATAPAELHVSIAGEDFLLKWQQGGTVLDTTRVPRVPLVLAEGSVRYPNLQQAAAAAWRARSTHRAPTDAVQERAVLHAPNSLPFQEVTAMLDALHGPKRTFERGRSSTEIPAFAVAFATD